MSFTTKNGKIIRFVRDETGDVMIIRDGHGKILNALALSVDDLMELQNEVYVALHDRPDPEITAARADDERIKRLVAEAVGGSITTNVSNLSMPIENAEFRREFKNAVKESIQELIGGASQPTQFVQNNYQPEALSAETIYRQTQELLTEKLSEFFYGLKPGERRPSAGPFTGR